MIDKSFGETKRLLANANSLLPKQNHKDFLCIQWSKPAKNIIYRIVQFGKVG